jgi:outer membrane protein TolC
VHPAGHSAGGVAGQGRSGPHPDCPAEAVAGIPAELLRRRPDVRRAAAQSAQIGAADAEFYPHISITGSLGYAAGVPLLPPIAALGQFGPRKGFEGNIGPTFQWSILQYERLLNNVRLQEARFQELVDAYQSTVLTPRRKSRRAW